MPKSRIIKEIVNNEINVLMAIDRLYLIAYDLNDENVCSWIKDEKNGYKNKDVPQYRRTSITPIGTYQIISAGRIETYSDSPLPTNGIPKENIDEFNNWAVKDSLISLIRQKELSDNGKMTGIPLDPVFFSWFQKNTNIIMRKAMLYISPLNLETILDSIKSRIIDLLLLYENNFGVLDELDISYKNINKEDSSKLYFASKSIIDGSFNGKTKIIIKGSNLGQGNTINKSTDITTNVTLSKKDGFFKKIWRKIFK